MFSEPGIIAIIVPAILSVVALITTISIYCNESRKKKNKIKFNFLKNELKEAQNNFKLTEQAIKEMIQEINNNHVLLTSEALIKEQNKNLDFETKMLSEYEELQWKIMDEKLKIAKKIFKKNNPIIKDIIKLHELESINKRKTIEFKKTKGGE